MKGEDIPFCEVIGVGVKSFLPAKMSVCNEIENRLGFVCQTHFIFILIFSKRTTCGVECEWPVNTSLKFILFIVDRFTGAMLIFW